MKINKKRGISPVIATVLLIAVVVMIAVIILIFSKSWTKERLEKFDKAVENVCPEVKMHTFVNDDGSFGFTNTGNVPVYAVDLKLSSGGKTDIERINGQIDIGLSTIFEGYNYYGDGYDEVKIIPVLLGKSPESGGQKEYTCPDKQSFVV